MANKLESSLSIIDTIFIKSNVTKKTEIIPKSELQNPEYTKSGIRITKSRILESRILESRILKSRISKSRNTKSRIITNKIWILGWVYYVL